MSAEERPTPRFFTHYWSATTWERSTSASTVLDHTAGNQFRNGGVRPGDIVYVVSSERGRLRLIGRMRVERILDQQGAERYLGRNNLWDAREHCVAPRESATPYQKDLTVPMGIVRRLRFESSDGPKPPVLHEGLLDRQTLRAIRELTPESAALLDSLLPQTKLAARSRNPKWTRDELILALELYKRVDPLHTSEKNPKIVALSQLLNSLPLRPREGDAATFRNPSGVYMKLCNFLRLDPNYSGAGLKAGGKLEVEIWREFANDEKRLRATAAAIRENAAEVSSESLPALDDGDDLDFEAEEGRILTRSHQLRERNPKLVKLKKKAAKRQTGKLACEVCAFEFVVRYGERGEDYAECHHDVALSLLRPGSKTKLVDLRILCSNCHRMIHRRRPWLAASELRDIVQKLADGK